MVACVGTFDVHLPLARPASPAAAGDVLARQAEDEATIAVGGE
jgi:hypothetical protein